MGYVRAGRANGGTPREGETDVLDWLKNLWKKAAHGASRPMTATWIPADRAGGVGGESLVPNESYVQITVKRMFLRDARNFWKEKSPVAHSFVSLQREGAGEVTIPFIVDAGKLGEIDPDAAQLIIVKNIDVMPPTPYIGESIEVGIGLCAAVSRDYLKNLLGVLGSLSAVVGSTPLTSALNIVPTLKDAAEQFLGIGDDVELRIGVVNGFNPNVGADADGSIDMAALKTGVYALVAAPADSNIQKVLEYRDGELLYRASDAQLYRVEFDHLVFEISQSKERSAWGAFSDLLTQKKVVLDAASNGNLDENQAYKDAMAVFKKTVVGSADLTEVDRIRIWKGLEKLALQYAGDDGQAIKQSADAGSSMRDVFAAYTVEQARDAGPLPSLL